MVSFPPVSPPRPYTPPSSHPYAPHAQPISFFSVLSPAQYWVRSTILCTPTFSITFLFLLIFCFFSLRRSSYFYLLPILLSLLFLDFTFFYFPPLLSHPFSSLCPILLLILLFHLLFCLLFFFSAFLLLRTFFSSWPCTERLAVTNEEEEETKKALPLTVLLSAFQRHTFWLSLWCVTQYNKQV